MSKALLKSSKSKLSEIGYPLHMKHPQLANDINCVWQEKLV